MRFFRSRSRLLAAALTTAGVAAAGIMPGAAGAQTLQNVAIVTGASGGFLALDVAGGSTADGGGLIQWYGHFSGNQRFNLIDNGHGAETIVNQQSGKCLTTDGVAGDQIYQSTCNGSSWQLWEGTLKGPLEGSTSLFNPVSGLNMDISGGSPWAGAELIGWYPNGGANQQFMSYQLS